MIPAIEEKEDLAMGKQRGSSAIPTSLGQGIPSWESASQELDNL